MAETVLQTLLEQLFIIHHLSSNSPEEDSHFRKGLATFFCQPTYSMSDKYSQCIICFLQKLIESLTFATDVSPPLSIGEKRLLKTQEYMQKNYKKDIHLVDIARHVGLSEEALCRFFRKYTSQTLSSYLNEIRIEASSQMLRETDDLISLIAYSCGFNTIGYFNKVFKQSKGMTPAKYRGEDLWVKQSSVKKN